MIYVSEKQTLINISPRMSTRLQKISFFFFFVLLLVGASEALMVKSFVVCHKQLVPRDDVEHNLVIWEELVKRDYHDDVNVEDNNLIIHHYYYFG